MRILNMIGAPFGLYRIVPANEAHVRVMFDKKQLFASRGKDVTPSYWVTPFVTKIHKMPLTNIRINVPDIKLNDKNMAKFLCDIVCFVNISDPILAAERTDITTAESRYEDPAIRLLSDDFSKIMASAGRTASTQQDILGVYMNREFLQDAVKKQVQSTFLEWGLQLVDLEIVDLRDVPGSTIILDIEKKIAATINADARVRVAEESKRAVIVEAEQGRLARFRAAEMEEEAKKREIEKDKVVAVTQQEREMAEATKTAEANAQKVEAKRKIEVGFATVDKESTIQRAEATRNKIQIEAEGQARQIFVTGEAEANIIKLKKLADAEGTEKLAEAMQKYDDSATRIQFINANRDVGLEYAKSYQALTNKAQINIMAGSAQEVMSGGLLGTVKLGPKEGVALGQFLEANPELLGRLLDSYVGKKEMKK